jgi:hypothetical protein
LSYNLSDGNSYDRYAFAEVTKKLLHKKTLRLHLPLPAVRALAGLLEGAYGFTRKMPALNREKLRELSAANWTCSIWDRNATWASRLATTWRRAWLKRWPGTRTISGCKGRREILDKRRR